MEWPFKGNPYTAFERNRWMFTAGNSLDLSTLISGNCYTVAPSFELN